MAPSDRIFSGTTREKQKAEGLPPFEVKVSRLSCGEEPDDAILFPVAW